MKGNCNKKCDSCLCKITILERPLDREVLERVEPNFERVEEDVNLVPAHLEDFKGV